jgi:hypothetical protein
MLCMFLCFTLLKGQPHPKVYLFFAKFDGGPLYDSVVWVESLQISETGFTSTAQKLFRNYSNC